MNVPPNMKSEGARSQLNNKEAARSQFDNQEAPPSYEEACSSSYVEERAPEQAQYDNPFQPAPSHFTPPSQTRTSIRRGGPQHYTSLLPDLVPGEQNSPGLSPNYNQVTSSIPEDFSRRARSASPEGRWGYRNRHHEFRWGSCRNSCRSKCAPKPEGVPLESVCDRFGNRKREIKWRGRSEMAMDVHSIRAALRSARM